MAKINFALRHYREERQIKQADVALQVQISQPLLCMIERGYKKPSPALVQKIADALGTKPEVIFPDVIVKGKEAKADGE